MQSYMFKSDTFYLMLKFGNLVENKSVHSVWVRENHHGFDNLTIIYGLWLDLDINFLDITQLLIIYDVTIKTFKDLCYFKNFIL